MLNELQHNVVRTDSVRHAIEKEEKKIEWQGEKKHAHTHTPLSDVNE